MAGLRIAFVGQCHTVGYVGVPADAAFPEVFRKAVQARRPEHEIALALHPYYHPADLCRIVRVALRQQPRAVVIEVVGWLAITGSDVVDLSRLPKGVRSAFQRAQHLRHVSRQLAARAPATTALIYQVQSNALAVVSTVLRPLLPRYPRPTIAAYEAAVTEALSAIRPSGVSAVVQGPGAPNLALDSKRLASDAIERYRAVNGMAHRVAAANGALYVDRWDTVAAGFFIPGTTRPTRQGHSVWGHLLADRMLAAGVV